MNAVDGSDHYNKVSDEPPPSLLNIIIDTNPHAWSLLHPTLPLSSAIANLLVFINAHLAFNNANRVSIIASHTQRAEFLYPIPIPQHKNRDDTNGAADDHDNDDTVMANDSNPIPSPDANHYRPFRLIQRTLLSSLTALLKTTSPHSLTPTTSLAGALTLALSHTNRLLTSLSTTASTNTLTTQPTSDPTGAPPSLDTRILILSVSGDLSSQYIPLTNNIFACQRLRIPIDILKLRGDETFLQQASDATHGTYIKATEPRGLLQYLMMGFLPDGSSRRWLVPPTAATVDFRAACFCHRRVVDVGFVCSICLSIFCSPPEGAICLTCGTHLGLGDYGGNPVVVAKKKKKRKDEVNGKRQDEARL